MGLDVVVLKLADPLYRLQNSFYEIAGLPLVAQAQDQVLLEMIARQLRRITPVLWSLTLKNGCMPARLTWF